MSIADREKFPVDSKIKRGRVANGKSGLNPGWCDPMDRPVIALFGNAGSSQVDAVREALLEEGAAPEVFDIQLGGPAAPAFRMGGGRAVWQGRDFSDIQAIHIRCTAPNTLPALPPVLHASAHGAWRQRYLLEQEYQSAIFSFFSYLHTLGKLVINPLTSAYIDHDSKSQLYEKLRANGFPAPRTLTTNDPDRAVVFLDSLPEAVVKPAVGVGSTRVITQADRGRLEEIRHSPVMMQERIEGSTLRIHIVGDTVVLALRILSEGGVDSRTETKNFEYVALPEAEAARIVRANRFLGLHYAAWDIIEADDGRYVYLDCNPGPYVMWIGPAFVRIVFRQLARYMIAFTRTGDLEAASRQVTPWRP